MMNRLKNLIQFILFQLGYFIALYSAKMNLPYYALLYSFIFLLIHFKLESDKFRQELIFLCIVLPFGVISDYFLDLFGVYSFLTPKNIFQLIPEWLIALWLIFPPLFGRSLAWMRGKYLLAFFFGLIFSPLSYRFGAQLGVIEIPHFSSYIVMGILWGTLMSTFIYFRQKLDSIKAY